MRFSVLDSWRGLCALWVVLYHFRVLSHVSDLQVTRFGFIAVDFFFALSGFVIAYAYGDRLKDAAGRVQFFLRRFGRLYPLHLATLLVVVALEAARWGASLAIGSDIGRQTFTGETGLPALAANVALLHGLGIFADFTWNIPSWSISVELAVCLIYALASTWRRPVLTAVVLAVAASGLLLWFGMYFPIEGRTALTRGVCGFFLGVLAQQLYRAARAREWSPPGWLELATPFLVYAAMRLWKADVWPASALIFATLVFLFAFEAGPLSRLMKAPFLVKWGEVSYSIYLIHYPMVLIVFGAAAAFGAVTGTNLLVAGKGVSMTLGSPWLGDLATVAFLAAVIAVAGLTYRWIESPGRRWFNRISDRAAEKVSGGER
jgi:peptidoglycan/LPS O-acetylase OafA/YrhL